MANITGTGGTADAWIDEFWNPELNRAINFDMVIADLFSDFSSRMKGSGDVFHWPDSHHGTAATKSASIDLTPEAITENDQSFTVGIHQGYAVEVEDFAEVMSKYDIRADRTRDMSYVMARALDVSCANLFDDNTAQTVGALTAELTDDNLIRAWQYGADNSGKGVAKGVVSPAAWGGLLKIEKFTNQLFNGDTGGKALHEAQIGKVYNATFYQSQLTVGTAPNSSGHLWWGDHFFKIIKKSPTIDAWKSPLAKAWIVAIDQIYGVFERQEPNEGAGLTTRARLHGCRLQTLK